MGTGWMTPRMRAPVAAGVAGVAAVVGGAGEEGSERRGTRAVVSFVVITILSNIIYSILDHLLDVQLQLV